MPALGAQQFENHWLAPTLCILPLEMHVFKDSFVNLIGSHSMHPVNGSFSSQDLQNLVLLNEQFIANYCDGQYDLCG